MASTTRVRTLRGQYDDSSGVWHGFLYSGSSFTTVSGPPGATTTVPQGINDAGQIVGYYLELKGNAHGFIDSGGQFTTIDDPSAFLSTQARGNLCSGTAQKR